MLPEVVVSSRRFFSVTLAGRLRLGAGKAKAETTMGKDKRVARGVEWVGAIVTMPAYVTGEGVPYRPEVLLWMIPGGPIVGMTMARPGELLGRAARHLQETIESPTIGRPGAPARLRVPSPELADVLRDVVPGTDVICAPTPELDDVFAMMRDRMGEDAETEQTYLSPGIGVDAVDAFFRATAGLFRANPWGIIPSDESVLSVTIEQLHVREAAVCVIGQMGQRFGFILFSDLDACEAYRDLAETVEHEDPVVPPHFALNFERGAELSAALRKEIAEHRWEVANADAYPWPVIIDEDLVARPPTAEELTIAEAISLALPQILAERTELLAAWNQGTPFARTVSVKSHAGEIEVTLRAPYEAEGRRWRPPYDVLADLSGLAEDDEEIDHMARRELEDELVRRFVESPEASALTDIQSCHFVMDFAADYFGATIATLGPSELREIVFEIIPRKVSIDASKARWIIDENRAFYAFLRREFSLEQADACLRVLGGDAVKKLEAALSNRANFGMAKSLFMAGREAGFDVDTKEGIEAWMAQAQDRPRPAGFSLPGALPVQRRDPAATRAKKNQRKAARKARKKNR